MDESSKSKGEEIARKLLEDPLELPDGAGFCSVRPKMAILQMVAISEKYLPILNAQPDFIEKKRKLAFGVPFSL